MDPIATDDTATLVLRDKVFELAKAIDPRITLHDFRMVPGDTHTNLIFDLAVPFDLGRSDREIKEEMGRLIAVLDPAYRAVIQIDKNYSV
jgi:hypothetical protein